jgi:hypothetical protein
VAYAPVSMGGANLVDALAPCGGITYSSITTARIVWCPRTAAPEGSDSIAAGHQWWQQRQWQQLRCAAINVPVGGYPVGSLLSNMLGGRIRSNVRQAGQSIYVDAVLSAEERQQSKAMQQLRQELRQQGVRTWWSKATLLRWRRSGADRRGSWEEVPPLPAEVPGSEAA